MKTRLVLGVVLVALTVAGLGGVLVRLTAGASACSAKSRYSDTVMGTAGLVGYWRLGESSGASACDHTGTSAGRYLEGHRLGQSGLLRDDGNRSVSLDGRSGSVRVPSVPALNPAGPFSLEAWMSPTVISGSQTILRKNEQFLLRLLSGSLVLRVWWNDGSQTEVASRPVVQLGGSQHVFASYDGRSIRLFLNGGLVASTDAAKIPAQSENPLLIGESGDYEYFSGRLDEVALYSAGLDAATASEHHLAGSGPRDDEAPLAPSDLTVRAEDASIRVDWQDGKESDLMAYRLYRRQPDGTWPSSPTQAVARSTAIDGGLFGGVTYEYRVTALDFSWNESPPSPVVSARPSGSTPQPPDELAAVAGATAVALRWAPSTPAANYHIYRRTGARWPETPVGTVPGDARAFVDEAPPVSAAYRVTSLDHAGRESVPTTEVTATLAPNVVLAAGDIAGCDTRGDEVTAAILDTQSGTVVTLGDNVYEDGSLREFMECYHGTWGRQRWRTRPALGDHEYRTPGASGYFSYFGVEAGDPSLGYYSFDQAGWHIVVLNSQCNAVGGCGAGSPQEQWLRRDLAASSTLCTLAVLHAPLFSSGATHGSQSAVRPFWQALYEGGADVVLSGNDHVYERFAPQTPTGSLDQARGVRQFIVGTGGRGLYQFATPLANSEVRNNDTFGVLRLALRSGAYDWSYLPEVGGAFSDAGSTSCH